MQRDFYEILGLTKNADQDAIKKAYRKLAMQFHPDKNPNNKDAEDKFKEAAAAYEVLSNPEKRTKYDRFGHAAFSGGAGGFGGMGGFQSVDDIFANFGDLFSDIFGGAGQSRGSQRRDRPRQGADLRYVLDITLQEVASGIEKEIHYPCEESCDKCEGTGSEAGKAVETCKTCGGQGQVVRSQGFFSVAATCPTCAGQGQVIKHPCKGCHGKGRLRVERKIKVKVPPGVDTGVRLRLTGEGEGGYHKGPAGDLYVEIRVKEDKRFVREGDDLIGQVKISYLQALLGTSLEIETLQGKEKLEIHPGVQPGESICLGGKGIPSLRGYARGDLYFKVEVTIPKKMKKEEEEKLREIAKLKDESVCEAVSGLFGRKRKPNPGEH